MIAETDHACLKILSTLSGQQGWQFFRHPKPSYGIYVKRRVNVNVKPSNDDTWTCKSNWQSLRQMRLPREEEFIGRLQDCLGTEAFFSDETDVIRVIGWNRTPALVDKLQTLAAGSHDGANVGN
jgi:hypothetical protein